MLDPVLHGALVVVAAFVMKWIFGYIGLELDEATLNTLAAAVVAYILSLFGLGLLRRTGIRGILGGEYKPPFT